MPSEPRLVLLTSNGLRHRYVAHEIAKEFRVEGIVAESKASTVSSPPAANDDDRSVIQKHFEERDRVERQLLGGNATQTDAERIDVPCGGTNSSAVFEFVRTCKPDFIIVYGTSIIRAPLLQEFAGRMINVHLGLSPYYRGAGTNFWPLVNGEPECVGATIHIVSERVDAGSILFQVRPAASAEDRVHDLGTKSLMRAVDSLPALLRSLQAHSITSCDQDLSRGRVYRVRDFNAAAVRTVWRKLDAGMMAEYCDNPEPRRQRFPIHSPVLSPREVC